MDKQLNFLKEIPLINAHTHAAMIAFRGLAEDVPLSKWLNKYIWPAEKEKVKPKFVYKNTSEAIEEMRKNHIKTFCDMYFFQEEVARACVETNTYVVLGEAILDFPTPSANSAKEALETTETLIRKYKNSEYVDVSVAPHAIYSASKETLKRSKALADKHKALIQIHISETEKEVKNCYKEHNLSPIEYLDSLNFIDEKTLLIHCVHLSDNDIDIIAKRKANVVHCPLSNLKLGSGIAPVAKMLSKGINVALGTDSAASSNRLDIWEAGKFTALLQKGITNDPTRISSKNAVKMMSVNGLRALNIETIHGRDISEIEEQIESRENFNELYSKNL